MSQGTEHGRESELIDVETYQIECVPTVHVENVENFDEFIVCDQHLNSIKICMPAADQNGGANKELRF
jgi:putative methionine-R-sulfoxide reductase with GAF domain